MRGIAQPREPGELGEIIPVSYELNLLPKPSIDTGMGLNVRLRSCRGRFQILRRICLCR